MGSERFLALFNWLSGKATGRVLITPTGVTLPLLKAMPYPFDKNDLFREISSMVTTMLSLPVRVLVSDQEALSCKGATLSYVRYAEVASQLQLYEAEVENHARIPMEMLAF